MRRGLICLLLALGLLLGNVPAASAASNSGTWGEIHWSFNQSTGELTLSGSGNMPNEYVTPPWLKFDDEIRSATVGSGVTSLAKYCFYYCEQLERVSLPDSLREIWGNAFYGCKNLAAVALPPQLTYIEGEAFSGCERLTAIDIPASIKTLRGYIFSGCENLKTVTLHPGLEIVGKDAFRGTAVTALTLPNTVTEIEESAFEGCGLQQITLSENLKTIGHSAFRNCGRLEYISLPASVSYVGGSAFAVTPLKTIVVRNPECTFATFGDLVGGVFGDGGANVYGYPGSWVQHFLASAPESPYTFKPLYFDDVAPGIWYYDSVSFAKEHALFQGVGDRSFAPEVAMSRGMVVQVLYNFAGGGAQYEIPFADVPGSAWFARAVAWAAKEGVVNGLGDGRFGAENSVTREQFAAIVHRFTRTLGIGTDGAADLSAFPDAASVSGWAAEAMAWAVGNGILTGSAVNGVNYLRPQATATRAQVAAIMMRCLTLWDSRTHTDLCIGVAYPFDLIAPIREAAEDYSARHEDVRIRVIQSDQFAPEPFGGGEDAVLYVGEEFRERWEKPGSTAAAALLRTPYVFMLRADTPDSMKNMDSVAERLRSRTDGLALPGHSPGKDYALAVLEEYGLGLGAISWQQEDGCGAVAYLLGMNLLPAGVGSEYFARRERLWVAEGSAREGRYDYLYAFYREDTAKKAALKDFFSELQAGKWDARFRPLGLYPME